MQVISPSLSGEKTLIDLGDQTDLGTDKKDSDQAPLESCKSHLGIDVSNEQGSYNNNAQRYIQQFVCDDATIEFFWFLKCKLLRRQKKVKQKASVTSRATAEWEKVAPVSLYIIALYSVVG